MLPTSKFLLVVAAVALLATPAKAWPDPVRTRDVMVLLPALVMIGADFSTSFDIKNHSFDCVVVTQTYSRCTTYKEVGPVISTVLGEHPTDLAFMAWGAGYMAVTTAAWYLTPQDYRWAVPLIVTVYEGVVVYKNLRNGMRFQLPAIHF